nr:hypothetical protein [Tanacetum cinerariifolium]
MLLMQAQKNEAILDEEKLFFIAGGQENAFNDDVDEPPVQDLALAVDNIFQANQCDAFDSNGRFVTAVKQNRELKESNYDQLYAYLKQHEAHANENKMMLDRYNQHAIDPLALVSYVSPPQYTSPSSAIPQSAYDKMLLMQAQKNEAILDEEKLFFIAGGQENAFNDDVDEPPVQDLALAVDNIFQADQCDAFDSNTIFMENLSSADPVYDEARPSYNSNILSEVPDHENYQDSIFKHHEVHEIHDNVQPHYVVNSHTDYANDSNMIPYDQYVKDNAVSVLQSNVSYMPNDAYMMIINEMHEPPALSFSVNRQHKVVNASLTAELATYKE